MPGHTLEPGSAEQLAGSPPGARLSAPPGQQRGQQQGREQVGEHEAPAGRQDPGALAQARPLIGPVVERGRADDQVKMVIGVGQPMADGSSEGRRAGVGGYGVLLASIWSKSPYPLELPPPPDHCHISAYAEPLVCPPKNRAQLEVPDRHQPDGWWARLLVNDS